MYRERESSCPSGYVYGSNTSPPETAICTNWLYAAISGRPLECDGQGPPTDVGNPCNVATGDKSQYERDVVLPGISFDRHYQSAAPSAAGDLGGQWGHRYATRLFFENSWPRILTRPSGHLEIIDGYSSPYRSISGSGIVVLQSGTEWIVKLNTGVSEIYDANGRLLRVIDEAGLVTALTYSSGSPQLLLNVVGPFGHTLELSYLADKIKTLSVAGQVVVEYSYNGRSNLEYVAFSDGKQKRYLYEDSRFPYHLTGRIDESGTRFSTYTYDATGRVIGSEHAGGAGRIDLVYGPTSTTVTNAAGLVSSYTFSASSSTSRRVASFQRGALLEVFQREPSFQRRVTRHTDARGVIRDYTYDDNHLTTMVEA